MVLRMIHSAIEYVDAPTYAGFKEDILDMFDKSIAIQKQKEIDSYKAFETAQNNAEHCTKDNHRGSPSFLEDELCNITAEMESVREIKDIKDELTMIGRVFKDQKFVLDSFGAGKKDVLRHSEDTLQKPEAYLSSRILRVEELLREARSVESSLNYLLDIKQKRGNLTVARNMRRLADQADQRARDGEWQTQLLFIFTIVTVIFW
ncbi:hypothetical protein K4K53_000350 [Colletotrichum sp. SAR 10_77]|nr:hypothetical protein K4K53_000350 [Colletotrichum sp. SAR 10_77]